MVVFLEAAAVMALSALWFLRKGTVLFDERFDLILYLIEFSLWVIKLPLP